MTSAIHFPYYVRSQSGADYWGLRLTAASMAVWAASFAIGFQYALIAIAYLSLITTAAGIFWPRIGLLGLGMAVTLDPLARTHLSTTFYRFNTLNYLMLLIIFLFLPIVLKRSDVHTRLLTGLVVVLGMGLAISSSPDLGAQHWLNLFAPFGMLVYFARSAGDSRTWLWTGILNGALSAAGGLPLYLQAADQGNYNVWSYFPLTGLISICLAFPFARRGRSEGLVLAGLAAVNTAWVFLSSSRGSLLIAVCCIAYLILATPGLSRRATITACSVLLTMAISAGFGKFQESALIRVGKLFDRNLTMEEATSRRSVLIAGGWQVFRENPLGVGTGGYALAAAPQTMQAFEGNAMQAHSAWVKTLAENGIAGTALLAAFVASYAYVGWRRRCRDAVLLGALTTVVLALAFLSTEFMIKGLWFLAMGANILLHNQSQARWGVA